MIEQPNPRVALITGVGRRRSIGSGLALGLATDGWDLALNYWRPYDDRLGYERRDDVPESVAHDCRALGATVVLLPGDLSDPAVPAELVAAARALGPLSGLVMSHGESVDSSILDTEVASWDRHFAVNARATWLLIKAFAQQLPSPIAPCEIGGRIVALTSDHTTHNLPYGASKGALDRIVTAAAVELADRGIRSNVINPGPVDTGWMDDVERGGWINGQILYGNGGFTIG